MKRTTALLFLLLAIGCRSTSAVPTPASARPPATGSGLPDSITWVRTSAEYVAAFEQTYRFATLRVETAASRRAAGAWAVILDADETILNNSEYQEERARAGLGFSVESWDAWVKRREATPLPGASAFLARVHTLGGRIAIVTNRLESQCGDTRAVLDKYALAYDAVLCQPDGQTSDKNPRFSIVSSGAAFHIATPVEVLAWIGDNILDFPGLDQSPPNRTTQGVADFGVRFFILPNPMYGSWQPPPR